MMGGARRHPLEAAGEGYRTFPGKSILLIQNPHLEEGGGGMLDPGGSSESPIFLTLFSRYLVGAPCLFF